MIPATTRGAILSVAAVLVLLFSFTTALDSAYRNTRLSRAEARYRSGEGFAAQGKNAEAEEEFRAALTYVHDDTRYRMALAQSLMALGGWGEAGSYLSELREDDPTSGPINLMLARIAVRDRRRQDAETYYQRAIYGLWPEHPSENRISTRLELVRLLEGEGGQQQVLAELLDLAGEIPASDVATRRHVASLLLAHGSFQHAAEMFQAILDADPDDAEALKGLADARFAMADYTGALTAYREAAQRGPANAELTARISTCEMILRLDPAAVHLSAGQRFERAEELVRRGAAAANECGSLPPDQAAAAEKAQQSSPRRRQDGDTLAMLNLAEQLWQTRGKVCPAAKVPDPALAAVMDKLQKQ